MGTEHRFPTDGPAYEVVKPSWTPPRLTAEAVVELQTFQKAVGAHLEPAPRGFISGRIATLLGHFFVPDIPAPLQQAMLEDWLSALAQFPRWAIANACQSWLSKERRKPTISDIVELSRTGVRKWSVAAHVVRDTLDKHDKRERSAIAEKAPTFADLTPEQRAEHERLVGRTLKRLRGESEEVSRRKHDEAAARTMAEMEAAGMWPV